MPADAGIQDRRGMDTGFRRYDGCPSQSVAQIVPALIFNEDSAPALLIKSDSWAHAHMQKAIMNEFAAAVGYRHSRGKRESRFVPAP